MQRVKEQRFWRSGLRAVPGTLAVGLLTFTCYGLRLDLTITGFLYLIIVVLQSLIADFVSSAIVSVIADLCLNFFFAPPLSVPGHPIGFLWAMAAHREGDDRQFGVVNVQPDFNQGSSGLEAGQRK